MNDPVKFDDDRLGVFCCGHVFRRERLVNFVMHQDIGYWQLLCGEADHTDPDEPYHVCIGVLLNVDPSLNEIANLPVKWEAERKDVNSEWIRSNSTATEH